MLFFLLEYTRFCSSYSCCQGQGYLNRLKEYSQFAYQNEKVTVSCVYPGRETKTTHEFPSSKSMAKNPSKGPGAGAIPPKCRDRLDSSH